MQRANRRISRIYHINTETYSLSPVGGGTFSVKRETDGPIVLYQQGVYGEGNASVNYQVVVSDATFSFNQKAFSLPANVKHSTR